VKRFREGSAEDAREAPSPAEPAAVASTASLRVAKRPANRRRLAPVSGLFAKIRKWLGIGKKS
jgi:hypothetical protein